MAFRRSTVRSRSAPPHVAFAALGICALVRAPASGSAGCGLDRTADPEAPLRLPQRESFRESSSRNLVALRRALVADSLSAGREATACAESPDGSIPFSSGRVASAALRDLRAGARTGVRLGHFGQSNIES